MPRRARRPCTAPPWRVPFPAMDQALQTLIDQVRAAHARQAPLRIGGGGTKQGMGSLPLGELLDTRPYHGIVNHEPTELVVTVRAGTPLTELEAQLAKQRQYLPFEPPRFASGGTVGGMVAAGLAGPARASAGGVRDYVLGVRMINGLGQDLHFGGQVMKNVAGYDVSRLMAGSWGAARGAHRSQPQSAARAPGRGH